LRNWTPKPQRQNEVYNITNRGTTTEHKGFTNKRTPNPTRYQFHPLKKKKRWKKAK